MSKLDLQSKEELAELAVKNEWLLLDFWATWCGPCQATGPIFERVTALRSDHLAAAKVNVDTLHDVAQEFNIRGVPTFILLHKGRVYDQRVGAISEPDFLSWLDSILTTNQHKLGA